MADVPNRYDLTISDGTDTFGYVLYPGWSGGESSNAPQKAIHSYSPTFIPRTNIHQTGFGDDDEDFFMTFSQKTWSGGELQRNVTDESGGTNRYWVGTNVDARRTGNVKMRPDVRSVDVGSQNVIALALSESTIFAVATTNLYEINADGTATDRGAHGLASPPGSKWAATADTDNVYFSFVGTSDTVRKWNGSAFSDFSTDGANSLLYHNNSLYGAAEGNFYRWSSAGTRSTLFSWLDADGGPASGIGVADVGLVSLGGKIYIGINRSNGFIGSGWIWDGVGVSKVIDYPYFFVQTDLAVHEGTVFIAGHTFEGGVGYRPTILFFTNGTMGTLWKGETTQATAPGTCVASFDNGVLFTDHATDKFMWYDSTRGGVQSIGTFTDNSSATGSALAVCSSFAILAQADDVLYQFPHSTSIATPTTVTSSLIDFDSSQNKLFRGVRVEYDEAATGDGGSVDISYRLEDADGSFTSLQTGITSGTEYAFGSVGSPITGRAISIRVTLNKGTSTLGPVLKRIYVRAAPQVTQRHRGLYHIDCTAPNSGSQATKDHVGSLISRSGQDMVMELREFADAGNLLTITDPLHSFTGVIELLEIYQTSSNEDPSYVVRLGVREV